MFTGPPPAPPEEEVSARRSSRGHLFSHQPVDTPAKPLPEPIVAEGRNRERTRSSMVSSPASERGERSKDDALRAERRKQRVERKLNELEDAETKVSRKDGELHFDMIEFAEKYFNNHEKSPEGINLVLLVLKIILLYFFFNINFYFLLKEQLFQH